MNKKIFECLVKEEFKFNINSCHWMKNINEIKQINIQSNIDLLMLWW